MARARNNWQEQPREAAGTDLVGMLAWIEELTKDVPEEEWESLPKDLAANHEHYLYGHPKQST
jgi:hypothetical protein